VKISIEKVNALERDTFVAWFGGLYEHSAWAAEAAAGARPLGSRDDLRGALVAAVEAASRECKMELVRAHPDLAGKAAMAGELTPESSGEQSSVGLDRLSLEEYEAFTRMNRAYREKFEMPMILCVREHANKESILRNAEERLDNTHEEEVEVALVEIHKIARLRLEDLVEEVGR